MKPIYALIVYIKNTGGDNGPGHVSASFSKVIDGRTTELSHTSFFPGPVGSFINALSFGSIPVEGFLSQNVQQDLSEADDVVTINLTHEQYLRGLEAQKSFKEEVATGKRTYSVFGKLNPLASLFSHGIAYTAEGYRAYRDQHFSEDIAGIPLYPYEAQKTADAPKVDNCTTSVTHVIHATGISFKNPEIPSFFSEGLRKSGFSGIEKDTVMHAIKPKT